MKVTSLYRYYRNQRTGVVVLVMSLYVLTPWTLFYTDKLMPDGYLVVACFAAITALYRYKFRVNYKWPFMHALVFSISLFVGLLSKSTILFLGPSVLFVLVSDVVYRRGLKFWVYAIGLVGALFGLYLLELIAIGVLSRFVLL